MTTKNDYDDSQVRDVSKIDWNVTSRTKTSAFPWRGQFTPDLVSKLFDRYDTEMGLILDPFMGSGTVIAESIIRGRGVVGVELNPAAYILSSLFELSKSSKEERARMVDRCESKIDTLINLVSEEDLFSTFAKKIEQMTDSSTRIIFSTVFLLAAKNSKNLSQRELKKAFLQVSEVLADLPNNSNVVSMYCGDARYVNLDSSSVGFVVTSPPYINVFNYHQNYRLAVEALGWKVLERAKTEIGSNRKHRGNRLYTVIQYAIDMALFINELDRLLMKDGVAAIVVGRESNVRGMSFKNADIFRKLFKHFENLNLIDEHTRRFTSRYGTLVYEEILVVKKIATGGNVNQLKLLRLARNIGREMLVEHLNDQSDPEKRRDLSDAIDKCDAIAPSPRMVNVDLIESEH